MSALSRPVTGVREVTGPSENWKARPAQIMKIHTIFSIAILLLLNLVACGQTAQEPEPVTPVVRFVTVTPTSLPPPTPFPTPVLPATPSVQNTTTQAGISSNPSSHPIRFTNVAEAVGLDFQHGAFRWEVSADPVAMMGGGLCWLDFDRDGWLDLFVVNSYAVAEAGKWEAAGGLPRSALFRNVGGRFTDVSSASGANLALRGNGCVAADFNLDGWPDLYLTTARFNALLWNNGDGTFTEGAEAAGVDAYGWQSSAVVGDLNADGWPDLFVAGYVDINNRIPEATLGFPNTYLGQRDLLFISEGVSPSGYPTFREVGQTVGLETDNFEYGLGALLTDLDGDGDLDLYIANDTNPNRLYENVPWPGGREADPEKIGFRFKEWGGPAKVDDNNSGMGIAGGDYNNDGRFDLFITNLGQQLHTAYLNQTAGGGLSFRNTTGELGIRDIGVGRTGWGTTWADFDLDTDLDLMVVNGSVPVIDPLADAQVAQLFGNLTAQGQAGQFEDITDSTGLDEVGPLLGRGGAVADFNNDGDLDMAVNTIGGRLALLENSRAAGNWLEVQLDGFNPGAIVTAVLPDGRELRREVHAGSSYLSTEDPRCHFGLGSANEVSELRIRWPNGEETRLGIIAANQIVVVHL
jgi:hypothetical protein